MRPFILGVFLVLVACVFAKSPKSAPSHSNNILVLIQPALAGPNVNPLNYWQPQWVLWPPAQRDSDGGRLLSISTGANWVGTAADFQFDSVENGRAWRARNYRGLVGRGHFAVRAKLLGNVRTDLLVDKSGSASPNALRLALNSDSPIVRPYRTDSPSWPAGGLMVTEASGWDDIAEFERSTSGRVLVVEYPPRPDAPWTRYWLRGAGWSIHGVGLDLKADSGTVPTQRDLPVPGLIRARLLIPLVTEPDRFRAVAVTVRNWPGANRFLETRRSDGTLVGALWILSVALIVIWGVVLVANERTSDVAPVCLVGALLSPAIVDLAGLCSRYLGVEMWPVWIGLCSVALIMAASGLASFFGNRLPRAHSLLAVFVLGLLVLCLVNPIWSFMSPLFSGRTYPVSPLAVATLAGYLVGVVSCVRGCGRAWTWAGRGLCLGVLVAAVGLSTWWGDDLNVALLIPVAAALVGEGQFRWQMLLGFVLWPPSFVPLVVGGFIWAPLGLLCRGRDIVGLNSAEYVDFLINTNLWIFILLGGCIAIFGYRFFFHQLRLLLRIDTRRLALPTLALVAAAAGLLHPSLLSAALVLATGAMVALLRDAVQTM